MYRHSVIVLPITWGRQAGVNGVGQYGTVRQVVSNVDSVHLQAGHAAQEAARQLQTTKVSAADAAM